MTRVQNGLGVPCICPQGKAPTTSKGFVQLVYPKYYILGNFSVSLSTSISKTLTLMGQFVMNGELYKKTRL